jgi:rubrerythrin
MEIAKFLTLGTDLENLIAGLYEKVAALTLDAPTSKALMKISREEINHASTIKMGNNFLREAPEVFVGVQVEEEELKQGLRECGELRDRLDQNLAILPALKSLLSLEKRFEKIHLGASIVVTDEHLKRLFQSLAKGDQNHIKTLEELIAAI